MGLAGGLEGPGRAGSAASGWSRRGAPSRPILHLQCAAEMEIVLIYSFLACRVIGDGSKRNNLPLPYIFWGVWK